MGYSPWKRKDRQEANGLTCDKCKLNKDKKQDMKKTILFHVMTNPTHRVVINAISCQTRRIIWTNISNQIIDNPIKMVVIDACSRQIRK